jgi:hypothetical protein
MSDNGSKSEAQLEQEKLEAKKAHFAQRPDDFIDLHDVVIAAIKVSDGIGVSIYISPGPRSEWDIALSEITQRLTVLRLEMDISAMKPGNILSPGRLPFGGRKFNFKR